MILTTEQAAIKLGITSSRLAAWTRKGIIQSINKPENSKKRVNYKFDSKVINEFLKADSPLLQRRTKKRNIEESANTGMGFISSISNRLNSIESKLDELLRIWK